jgi:hypothetical protein
MKNYDGIGNRLAGGVTACGGCAGSRRRRFQITDLRPIESHKAVRQRLHEAHNRILFCLRQAEVPDFAPVHVLGRFRRGPAGRAFTGIVGLAA